tara:strand:+ start:79 stop:204 length:126 start_codon:yes stop_codon:yes gene_type:complete
MKAYKKRRASELDLESAMKKNLIKRKIFQKKLKSKKNDTKR